MLSFQLTEIIFYEHSAHDGFDQNLNCILRLNRIEIRLCRC